MNNHVHAYDSLKGLNSSHLVISEDKREEHIKANKRFFNSMQLKSEKCEIKHAAQLASKQRSEISTQLIDQLAKLKRSEGSSQHISSFGSENDALNIRSLYLTNNIQTNASEKDVNELESIIKKIVQLTRIKIQGSTDQNNVSLSLNDYIHNTQMIIKKNNNQYQIIFTSSDDKSVLTLEEGKDQLIAQLMNEMGEQYNFNVVIQKSA